MACLTWELADGKRYTVPEGVGHVPPLGAKMLPGVIDWNCGDTAMVKDELSKKIEDSGIRWGDAIAWVTKRLGVKQCAPCKARQEILNNVAAQGWASTLKQIRETLV